jgi:hypothetical protein
MATGCDRLQDGRPLGELQRLRDDALVGFLKTFDKVTATT